MGHHGTWTTGPCSRLLDGIVESSMLYDVLEALSMLESTLRVLITDMRYQAIPILRTEEQSTTKLCKQHIDKTANGSIARELNYLLDS